MSFPDTRLRRLRRTAALRDLVRETELTPGAPDRAAVRRLGGGARRVDAGRLARRRSPARSPRPASSPRWASPGVLLFGIPDHKDAEGSGAWDDEGAVQLAVRGDQGGAPADSS